jgi:transglutaminase-like putative cysteine protease
MQKFLRSTDVVDSDHPEVARRATSLRKDNDILATVRACFQWVRDEVQHSADAQCGAATCRASDVLAHRTGYCYAKSHLLAALVRANGIAAGFCYQRLSINDDGAPFCLHGFNAIFLPDVGWYRVDPRGNRPGIDAQCDPPLERLAFTPRVPGEIEFENILPDPLPCVVAALTQSRDWKDVLERLPDVSPEDYSELGFDLKSQTQTP